MLPADPVERLRQTDGQPQDQVGEGGISQNGETAELQRADQHRTRDDRAAVVQHDGLSVHLEERAEQKHICQIQQ